MAGKSIVALSAAVIFAMPLCFGQMRGGFRNSGHGSSGFRASFSGQRQSRSAIPLGYFVGDTPFFYEDYPFDRALPEPAQPQAILTPSALDGPPQAKTPPLLIELRGDRYVRYGGAPQSPGRDMPASPIATNTSKTLPSTVLVYRDGMREEIPDYAIVGQVIYAHTLSNGQAGYGMKNIQVSALDLPATIKANHENGVSFVLPAGPNEVVTRP